MRAVGAVALSEVEHEGFAGQDTRPRKTRPIKAVAAQSLYSTTLGLVLPARAMAAEMNVNVKMAAEAPLNLRALTQMASPPTTGAMLPTR